MDIEINEVQEIIKNLESSGELSIKEEKYLKVAKLCGKLVAERDAATLEYDCLNDQIEYWKNKSINITEQRNELAAENMALKLAMPEPRNVEFDNDSMDDVSLAEDVGFNDAIGQMKINISKTPATDRIVAGIKADGVEQAASECYGAGYICETLLAYAQQLREGVNHD